MPVALLKASRGLALLGFVLSGMNAGRSGMNAGLELVSGMNPG
jgi:hypothetical protein